MHIMPNKDSGGVFADHTISEEKNTRKWSRVLLILLGLYLIAFSIINFCGFTRFMNYDFYADTLIARYIWESKSIFPPDWVFGNQYYVVATPVLAAPFYGLTGSMNLSMALATTGMTVFQLAAFYWLFRSFFCRTTALAGLVALVSSALAMGIAYKFESQLFFVLCSYYACYLLTAVIVWGDYTQALLQGKKMLCPAFFLGLALSFATGMQSIRQTCVMVLPLLAFEGLRVLFALFKRRGVNWRVTLRAVLVSGANLAGLVFIHLLQIPSISIIGATTFLPLSRLPGRFLELLTLLKEIAGLAYISSYTPLTNGFVLVFSLAAIAAVLAAAYRGVTRFRRGNAGPLEVWYALGALSLLAVCMSILLLNINAAGRSLYLFIWYFLVCVSVVSLLDTDRAERKRAAMIALCVMSAANLYFSYWGNIRDSLAPLDSNAAIARDLEDSGYDIVYGPFGRQTSSICGYTDGKLIYVPYIALMEPIKYCTSYDLFEPEANQSALYLIRDKELEAAQNIAAEQGAELTPVLVYGGFSFYSASTQLMR